MDGQRSELRYGRLLEDALAGGPDRDRAEALGRDLVLACLDAAGLARLHGEAVGPLLGGGRHEPAALLEAASAVQAGVMAGYMREAGHRAEVALADRDLRLDALARNLPGVVFQRVLHPDGTVTYPFIAGGRSLMAPDGPRSLPDETSLTRRLGPDQSRRWRAALDESARTLGTYDFVMEVTDDEGRRRWRHSIAEPRRMTDGTVVWDGLSLDITAQRQAEAEARRARELLREAVESLSEGFAVFGPDDRLVLFNETYRRLHDWLGERLRPGLAFSELIDAALELGAAHVPEGMSAEEWAAGQLAAHARVGSPHDVRLLDGRWMRIIENPMPSGGSAGLRVNVTDSKRREAELSRRTEELAVVLDSMAQGLLMVDGGLRITLANARVAEVLGLPAEAVATGRTIPELADIQLSLGRVTADAHARIVADWQDLMHRPRSVRAERRMTDGSYLEVRMEPLGMGGFVVTVTDMSEQRRVEARLEQTARLATLGEMAAGVSHELTQPLNVIRIAAESAAISLEEAQADPEEIRHLLEVVAGQTQRMSEIIQNMRVFAQRPESEPTACDPAAVARSAARLLETALRLDGVALHVAAPDGMPPVLGRPERLEQAILNLLSNARDAVMVRGGTDGAVRLCVAAPDGAERVAITVADTGDGVPPEVMPHIFEPFFTTKEVGQGTGLGLSVTYGIVRAMGGTLDCRNGPEGAVFTMTLPALRDPAG